MRERDGRRARPKESAPVLSHPIVFPEPCGVESKRDILFFDGSILSCFTSF
jgi:hypothetical protein